MLRVTGAMAAIATALLAVLLFARIQSFALSGTLDETINGNLHILVKNQTRDLNVPASFKVLFVDTGGGTILIFGGALGSGEIPVNAAVDVTHRWVGLWLRDWAFGCTEVRSGGRSYPYVLSPAAFYWTLGAVTAAPLLCWSVFALAAALHRTRRTRD